MRVYEKPYVESEDESADENTEKSILNAGNAGQEISSDNDGSLTENTNDDRNENNLADNNEQDIEIKQYEGKNAHYEKHLALLFIFIISAIAIPACLTGSISGAVVLGVLNSNAKITGTFLVLISVILIVSVLFHKAHVKDTVEECQNDAAEPARQLMDYILDARASGDSKETIIRTLIASGWQKKIVMSYVNYAMKDDISEYEDAMPKLPPAELEDIEEKEKTLSSAEFDTLMPFSKRAAAGFVKTVSQRGFSRNEILKALTDKKFPEKEAKKIINKVCKNQKKKLKHKHKWNEKPVQRKDLTYLNRELEKLK